MKILFITQNIPFPPYFDGERLIIFNLVKELSGRHEVDLITFAFEEEFTYEKELSKYFKNIRIFLKSPKNPYFAKQGWKRICSSLQHQFFWIFLSRNKKITKEINKIITDSSYDAVVVEGFLLSPLYKILQNVPTVIYAVDCFSLNIKRKIKATHSLFLKLLYKLYLKRLERLEKAYSKFDRCIVVSERDKEALLEISNKIKISVIANGVDLNYYKPLKIKEDFPSVIFSGVMNYSPNVDAALYFYRKIFPEIKKKYPNVKYYIVGRDPVVSIKKLSSDPNVIVTGFVEDIRQYVSKASVCVVPMRLGSGIKNKILEAMAQEKAIVATSLGCSGIKVSNGENILIADDPLEFAQKVIELLENKNLRRDLGKKARRLVEENYTWEKASAKLENIIREISLTKIIQINSSSEIGGGPQVMFEIIKGLKDKFQFLVAVPEGEFLERYQKMNLKVYSLWQKNFLKNILKIREIVQREKADIVHCQGTRAAFWGRLAIIGLKNKPKIVYTLHGFHIIRRNFLIRWLLILMERFLNRWTDVLVCVSKADKNLVLKYKTISPAKIKVIKNGIDIGKFEISQDEIQKTKIELGLKDEFVISSIGRLHPPKDFSKVLKALKLIVSQIKRVKLLIIGHGPLRKDLENEAKNLKIENYVKFLGFRQDIPVLIGVSDIVVLSTNWEGLPLIPLEVGAARKPIVASDVDGVKETIIDGKTGFLFKVGLAEDLAEKILKLYNNRELREKLGENGYQFVSENFSKEKMVQRYKELYQSLK